MNWFKLSQSEKNIEIRLEGHQGIESNRKVLVALVDGVEQGEVQLRLPDSGIEILSIWANSEEIKQYMLNYLNDNEDIILNRDNDSENNEKKWENEEIPMMELRNVKTGEPAIVSVYHGTPDGRFLPEFDPNKKGYYPNDPDALPDNSYFESIHGGIRKGFGEKSVTGNIGVSFTDSIETAKSYADKPSIDYQNSVPMVVKRNVLLKNPKVIDLGGSKWNLSMNSEIENAINLGYDSLVFKGIKDNYHPSNSQKPSNNLIVFDVNNIRMV